MPKAGDQPNVPIGHKVGPTDLSESDTLIKYAQGVVDSGRSAAVNLIAISFQAQRRATPSANLSSSAKRRSKTGAANPMKSIVLSSRVGIFAAALIASLALVQPNIALASGGGTGGFTGGGFPGGGYQSGGLQDGGWGHRGWGGGFYGDGFSTPLYDGYNYPHYCGYPYQGTKPILH